MKLGDIVELAKQGYKPSDIRELIEISEATEAEEAKQKTPEDDPKKEEADAKKEPDKEPDPAENDDPIDYKALYESEKEKTARLQQTLTNKDMSGDNPNDLDTVLEAVKLFM